MPRTIDALVATNPDGDVLPCPFCGSAEVAPYAELLGAMTCALRGAVQCGNCGARGPAVRTGNEPKGQWRETAIGEWNRRAGSIAAAAPAPTRNRSTGGRRPRSGR